MGSLVLVTAAIIEKDGKYLITQRLKDAKSFPNLWEFPGGKVESNEGLEDCLKREISEELGIEIDVRGRFGSETYDYGEGLNIDLIGFYCDHISGEIQNKGIQNYRWVYPNEMEDYNFCLADLAFIEKLKNL